MTVRSFRRVGVALVLTLGGLCVACSSDEEGTGDAARNGSGSSAESATAVDGEETGASSTTVPVAGGETSGVSTSWDPDREVAASTDVDLQSSAAPAMMLIQFAQAWEDGNWKSMSSVAEAPVVAVATEWYEAKGEVSFDQTSVDEFLSGCGAAVDSVWQCELLYGPPGGQAGVFDLSLSNSSGGFRITELVFAGDAG